MKASTAWFTLDGDRQYQALRRFAASFPGRDKYGIAAWMKDGSETWEDALDTVINGAWLRMDAALERADAEGKPLAWALHIAVTAFVSQHGWFPSSRTGNPLRGKRSL